MVGSEQHATARSPNCDRSFYADRSYASPDLSGDPAPNPLAHRLTGVGRARAHWVGTNCFRQITKKLLLVHSVLLQNPQQVCPESEDLRRISITYAKGDINPLVRDLDLLKRTHSFVIPYVTLKRTTPPCAHEARITARFLHLSPALGKLRKVKHDPSPYVYKPNPFRLTNA